MSVDYYKVLFVERGCTEAEIKQGYKKMSLLHHPTRVRIKRPVSPSLRAREQELREKGREMDSFQMFYVVSEAYEVLSDPMRRAIYDLFGQKGLREGVLGPDGFIQPYAYHGDPNKTFREFFGTENPFIDLLVEACVPLNFHTDRSADPMKGQEPAIYRDLHLDLEEFYLGCVKKVMICKKVLVGHKKNIEFHEKVLTIPIKPGTAKGAKFAFPGEGDQSLEMHPPDIVFVACEQKHPVYQRDGNDLILEKRINLCKALTGILIPVTTLDKRQFNVAVVHIIRPGYEKVVPNEGFPIFGEPGKRGNLIIRFEVQYPNTLTQKQKELAKASLDCTSSETDEGGPTCYSKRLPVTMDFPIACACPFPDRSSEGDGMPTESDLEAFLKHDSCPEKC